MKMEQEIIKELTINEILSLLPHRYPFLLLDKVKIVKDGEEGIGIKNITVNEPQFTGHFPENPIMPGVLIMEAIIAFLMTQISIWAPSVVAVLGVIVSVAASVNKMKQGLDNINATNTELKKSKEFKQLHDDLRQAHTDNKELKDMIELLIDKQTKVDNYSLAKEKENEVK